MTDTIPGHDLHMARLTPEFSKWQAHLGFRVRQTEQWAPWSILRDKYGWPILTRATERCECNDAGFKNVNIVARICADMKRQEADAAKQSAQDQAAAEAKAKAKSSDDGIFAKLMLAERQRVAGTGEEPRRLSVLLNEHQEQKKKEAVT